MQSCRRVAALLVGVLGATGCSSATTSSQTQPAPEIAIATDFPVSPGTRDGGIGRALQDAVQLAVNDHPTVRGFRLRLVPYDYSGGPDLRGKGSQDLQRIVNEPTILGMVGPYESLVAEAEIPIANAAHLVIINASTTEDCLTIPLPDCQTPPASLRPSGPNNYFRLSAPDSQQARTMADFALRTLGVRRIAVFSDGTPYGQRIATLFSTAMAADGGAVVAQRDFDVSTVDFVPWLNEARNAGAEAIYAGGSSDTRTCTVREQMKQVFTTDLYFLGPDGIVTSRCLEQARDNLTDHIYGTLSIATALPASPTAAQVVARLQKAYPDDHQPAPYSLATYDAAWLLVDAIGRAVDAAGGKVPTRSQVLDAVAQTKDFAGATGTYSLTPTGDPQGGGVSVYQVVRGEWEQVSTG